MYFKKIDCYHLILVSWKLRPQTGIVFWFPVLLAVLLIVHVGMQVLKVGPIFGPFFGAIPNFMISPEHCLITPGLLKIGSVKLSAFLKVNTPKKNDNLPKNLTELARRSARSGNRGREHASRSWCRKGKPVFPLITFTGHDGRASQRHLHIPAGPPWITRDADGRRIIILKFTQGKEFITALPGSRDPWSQPST